MYAYFDGTKEEKEMWKFAWKSKAKFKRYIKSGSEVKVKVKLLSCVGLFATLWTVAYQAPPSMGFSRQEYWSGLPFPPPVDLPDPGIEPGSPTLQADSLPSELPGKPLLKPYCLLSTASWIHS